MKLISNELVSLLNTTTTTNNIQVNTIYGSQGNTSNTVSNQTKNLLVAYFKRRAVGIIYVIVVLVLLLTTSIFTDLGFNVGEFILRCFKSILGF
jgi:hypothetical protein